MRMAEQQERLARLHERQQSILHRIQKFEGFDDTHSAQLSGTPQEQSHCKDTSSTEKRLGAELQSKGIPHRFVRVPSDYYEHDLEFRRACLQAESIQHLCKSIVMENTKLAEPLPGVAKYYCVIVQYAARLHAEKLKRCLYQAQKAAGGSLGTKAFNMRLCPEDISDRLTGFEHNAVTPIGSAAPDMPIVLSDRVVKQLEGSKGYMWLGGGEIDLKLGFMVADFIREYRPLILDCTCDD